MSEIQSNPLKHVFILAAALVGTGGYAQTWNHDQIVQDGKDIAALKQEIRDMRGACIARPSRPRGDTEQ